MKLVISGACGFIGINSVLKFLERGDTVIALDNLSRAGTAENLKLIEQQGKDFTFVKVDIVNTDQLNQAFAQHGRDADAVLHFAAQVAVTTSVVDPRSDFEINAFGTFNMLEATRKYCPDAMFLYSSTNKVYGKLEQAVVEEREKRYDLVSHPQGVAENAPLDFYSPYGCSKGSADQYVRDYARIYGLKTIVFRQSCIYGKYQFGVEDQGWVAWFLIASMLNRPITVYGNGRQVRDLLWVDDLVDLYIRAMDNIKTTSGAIYNAGGGPNNTLSLIELIDCLEELTGKSLPYTVDKVRPGDQKVFIADISKAQRELGWNLQVAPRQGIEILFNWLKENKTMIGSVLEQVDRLKIQAQSASR